MVCSTEKAALFTLAGGTLPFPSVSVIRVFRGEDVDREAMRAQFQTLSAPVFAGAARALLAAVG